MASLLTLSALDSQPNLTLFPRLRRLASTGGWGRYVLEYAPNAGEMAFWTFRAPQGLLLPLSATVHYWMASATAGTVQFGVQVEARTPGDVHLMPGIAFDAANTGSGTVPPIAGQVGQVTVALANADGAQAGDTLTVVLWRGDLIVSPCYVWTVDLRDAR